MNTLKSEIRFCADIGMWAIDRPIWFSCLHATKFCLEKCYNFKLYKLYKNMKTKDERNETAWSTATKKDAQELRVSLGRKKKGCGVKRFRFMTRGEAFRDKSDIARVENIAIQLWDYELWIPTRSWHNPLLWIEVKRLESRKHNLRILASTDPSDSSEDLGMLETIGQSTMFFGDDNFLKMPYGKKLFKCPKTWGKIKGACAVCKKGCFRTDKPVHVHLKQH